MDDPYRASILELAKARGIPVGQTEQDGLLATVQGLYDDLLEVVPAVPEAAAGLVIKPPQLLP